MHGSRSEQIDYLAYVRVVDRVIALLGAKARKSRAVKNFVLTCWACVMSWKVEAIAEGLKGCRCYEGVEVYAYGLEDLPVSGEGLAAFAKGVGGVVKKQEGWIW